MLVFLSPDRLHLLAALVPALTGTPWGIAAGGVLLTVLAARVRRRRSTGAPRPAPRTTRGDSEPDLR